jgi:hypothetical protein
MHIKIQNYKRALSILSQLFKASEVQNHIIKEAYEVVETPVLTAAKLLGRQKAAQMAPCISRVKCLRKTDGYSLLDCERNELVREELKIRPTAE